LLAHDVAELLQASSVLVDGLLLAGTHPRPNCRCLGADGQQEAGFGPIGSRSVRLLLGVEREWRVNLGKLGAFHQWCILQRMAPEMAVCQSWQLICGRVEIEAECGEKPDTLHRSTGERREARRYRKSGRRLFRQEPETYSAASCEHNPISSIEKTMTPYRFS
jgi:hypothetical protein